MVFDDRTGNGVAESTESGISGETVVLEQRQGAGYVVIRTATTTGSGGYVFQVAQPGEYRVRVVPRQGSNGNYSTPSSYELIIREGTEHYRRNFGTLNHRRGLSERRGPADFDGKDAAVLADAPQEGPDPLIDRVFEAWDDHFAWTPSESVDYLPGVEEYWDASGLLVAACLVAAASTGTILQSVSTNAGDRSDRVRPGEPLP
jgi:hypothetical protein